MLVSVLDGQCPGCGREAVLEKWRGYVKQEVDGETYEIEAESCTCPRCGHAFDPDAVDGEYGSAWRRFLRAHGRL